MYSEALAVLDHNTELFMIKEAHQQTLAKYEAKYGKL